MTFQVVQHLRTQKHKELDSRHSDLISCSSTFGNSGNTLNMEFYEEALITADIPLFKLNSSQLRTFLSKYTNATIPSDSSLRKTYVERLSSTNLRQLVNKFKNRLLWLNVDEITDIEKPHIVYRCLLFC